MTFNEKYKLLTPENKAKVVREINRLLAIQKERKRNG